MPDLLFSLVLILLLGFVGGQLAHRLKAPPLLGMMLVGILLGSQVSNLIADPVVDLADDLRTIAVMVILMRAGLGLDRDKLVKQGSVALRLGFLPALTEAIAIAIFSIWLFQFDWLTGLLLGCVISAESPAVIVPGMLRLKSLGWGVSKGIADAILTGSALSDVLVLLLFSLLLNLLSQGTVIGNALWLLPVRVVLQIILGIILGYLTAKLVVFCTVKRRWTHNSIQDTLVVASLALLLVVVASRLPYSGYLAVMAMGFFVIEFSPPLARRLRQEFNHLWIVAEIFLFVLMGATIELKVLEDVLLPGIVLLLLGLIFGRTIGWYLSTVGSNWTWQEKLFLLPGNSAKATVQAAIGAIPLSLGIPGGDIILAIAALSILITAPLGAWAIPAFAPKLLTKDTVDPTKTNLAAPTVILGAIAPSPNAIEVLTQVADLARRTNGEAIILYDADSFAKSDSTKFKLLTAKLLADIPYQFLTITDNLAAEILRNAKESQATAIVLSKGDRYWERGSLDPISRSVLAASNIPVTLL
ncbi:cation:proton antiporter [Pleurocapsales cyanobacterium LEGE 10410]|nr:cation:proton antiporter [Pleurocapsales cyanobacterium LEGE 10410]